MSDDLKLQAQAKALEYYLRVFFPRYGSAIETDGTYVPTYLGASTAGVTTYTTQDGFYARFMNVVFFNGRVIWTAATGTGTAIISLPFTSQNTSGKRYAISVSTTNVTFTNGSIQAAIAPNVAFFSMVSPATNAAGTAVAVEAAGDIIFSGWYCV
jgi:hypothetical protein